MRGVFKKYFIPHAANDHRPHFLRGLCVTVLLYLIVSSFFGSFIGSRIIAVNPSFAAEVLPGVLVDLTNADRVGSKLNYLVVSPMLTEAARLKAEDMAAKQYFAHTSPEGVSPWYWFREVGYSFSYAGENLAIDFSDSAAVDQAWMNSSGHRANILSSNFTEIGIAAVAGTYEGRPTTYVVQLFGKPLPRAMAAEPVFVPPPAPKPKPTAPIAVPVAPPKPTVAEASIKIIEETDKFIAIENTEATAELQQPPVPGEKVAYSNWMERLAASPNRILKYFYFVIAVLILFPIGLMISKEFKRHHLIHIIYGVLLLLLMLVLLYLSRALLFGEGAIQ